MNNCQTGVSNNIQINQTENNSSQSMEEYLKQKQQFEDQVDYQFIQRIIQELTQSCALPLPIPAASIPPLILQAAQWFWQNCDFCVEQRYFTVKNRDICRQCNNKIVTLPPQVLGVDGVYKVYPNYYFGQLGDFTLERMIVNNTILASGAGTTVTDTFGNGSGYNLTDMMAALYEISTFKTMFDFPVTYNYNEFSNKLVLLGDIANSDLVLQCWVRCKLQDLYKNYYFFRLCVCFGLRSMSTIMGAFTFKLPGGTEINYQVFRDMADAEIEKIEEWVKANHTPDYFIMSNTI